MSTHLINDESVPSFSSMEEFDSAYFSQVGVAIVEKNNIPKSILDPFSDLFGDIHNMSFS